MKLDKVIYFLPSINCRTGGTGHGTEVEADEKALREFLVEVALADDPYNGKRGK